MLTKNQQESDETFYQSSHNNEFLDSNTNPHKYLIYLVG